MAFCVDTSGWLDGWNRYYPRDVFPSLWQNLEERASRCDIIASEEVYVEVQKKDDDLHEWMKQRKFMLIPANESIQRRVAEVLATYPRLVDTLKGRSQADPFVIATAVERGVDCCDWRICWDRNEATNSVRLSATRDSLHHVLRHDSRTETYILALRQCFAGAPIAAGDRFEKVTSKTHSSLERERRMDLRIANYPEKTRA